MQGASDHAESEAIYLVDPDGNGIKLSVDRPSETWPRDAQDKLKMDGRPLDLDDLLAKNEKQQNG